MSVSASDVVPAMDDAATGARAEPQLHTTTVRRGSSTDPDHLMRFCQDMCRQSDAASSDPDQTYIGVVLSIDRKSQRKPAHEPHPQKEQTPAPRKPLSLRLDEAEVEFESRAEPEPAVRADAGADAKHEDDCAPVLFSMRAIRQYEHKNAAFRFERGFKTLQQKSSKHNKSNAKSTSWHRSSGSTSKARSSSAATASSAVGHASGGGGGRRSSSGQEQHHHHHHHSYGLLCHWWFSADRRTTRLQLLLFKFWIYFQRWPDTLTDSPSMQIWRWQLYPIFAQHRMQDAVRHLEDHMSVMLETRLVVRSHTTIRVETDRLFSPRLPCATIAPTAEVAASAVHGKDTDRVDRDMSPPTTTGENQHLPVAVKDVDRVLQFWRKEPDRYRLAPHSTEDGTYLCTHMAEQKLPSILEADQYALRWPHLRNEAPAVPALMSVSSAAPAASAGALPQPQQPPPPHGSRDSQAPSEHKHGHHHRQRDALESPVKTAALLRTPAPPLLLPQHASAHHHHTNDDRSRRHERDRRRKDRHTPNGSRDERLDVMALRALCSSPVDDRQLQRIHKALLKQGGWHMVYLFWLALDVHNAGQHVEIRSRCKQALAQSLDLDDLARRLCSNFDKAATTVAAISGLLSAI